MCYVLEVLGCRIDKAREADRAFMQEFRHNLPEYVVVHPFAEAGHGERREHADDGDDHHDFHERESGLPALGHAAIPPTEPEPRVHPDEEQGSCHA